MNERPRENSEVGQSGARATRCGVCRITLTHDRAHTGWTWVFAEARDDYWRCPNCTAKGVKR